MQQEGHPMDGPTDAEPATGASTTAAPTPGRGTARRVLAVSAALVGLIAMAVLYELQSSRIQSEVFTRVASKFGYALGPGRSEWIVRSADGPYDQRLGYTRLPELVERLDSLGYSVRRQARATPALVRAVESGVYPVYKEKSSAGLTVLDRGGRAIVSEVHPVRSYEQFDSVPGLVWRSLLFIESRDFLDERYHRRNPAIEWTRFARAVTDFALRFLGAERNVPGGSTLATQIEKFRHSPDGLTRTPRDKVRQMVSASLRAYRDGPDTFEERRRIVTEYLNSVPLAAQIGHGEVIGTAEGLWAWYGRDVAEVSAVLRAEPTDSAGRATKGEAFRQVLSLLLAHRRPSHYLARTQGRRDLDDLVDAHATLLEREGVIPAWLAEATCRARAVVRLLDQAPIRPSPPFAERKAANLARTHLRALTGMRDLHQLDRLDLEATSTIDLTWHYTTTQLLRSLRDPTFLANNGFSDEYLLAQGDPATVLYSVTILERTRQGNAVRVQTDNFDGPLSLAESTRLELGSTAKLRTLITYLEVVEELHNRLSVLAPDSLSRLDVLPQERLTRWAVAALLERSEMTRAEMLDAALARTYSASPSERFVTGGGTQTFSNFDRQFDGRTLEVREAFQQSVNLPFIRIMRDVVSYEMYREGAARVLDDVNDPTRRAYLERFADFEGSEFVRRFYRKYANQVGPQVFDALVAERRLGHRALAWAIRSIAPEADEEIFGGLVRAYAPQDTVPTASLADLYRTTDASPHSLSDLGYLAGVHPLELWVASYLLHHPGATVVEVLEQSREARIDVYEWLFRTPRRRAQDVRIGTVLEIEAFEHILGRWRRLGYPFQNIVPSLGTAIGSSGDRPLALAELVGIVRNDGIRLPVVRIQGLRVAPGTPFATHLEGPVAVGERVMSPEVAAAVRAAMEDVVERGTGWRARGTWVAGDGTTLALGGKTGTGDNRFRVFASNGTLLESRVVNRTATFVFFAGDRYFGVVTAYVPGTAAGNYRFTSALPAQVLRILGTRLSRSGTIAPPLTELSGL